MGEYNVIIKFPCGYEVNAKAKGFGVSWDGDLECFENCPLHGKKCNKIHNLKVKRPEVNK